MEIKKINDKLDFEVEAQGRPCDADCEIWEPVYVMSGKWEAERSPYTSCHINLIKWYAGDRVQYDEEWRFTGRYNASGTTWW